MPDRGNHSKIAFVALALAAGSQCQAQISLSVLSAVSGYASSENTADNDASFGTDSQGVFALAKAYSQGITTKISRARARENYGVIADYATDWPSGTEGSVRALITFSKTASAYLHGEYYTSYGGSTGVAKGFYSKATVARPVDNTAFFDVGPTSLPLTVRTYIYIPVVSDGARIHGSQTLGSASVGAYVKVRTTYSSVALRGEASAHSKASAKLDEIIRH